MAKRARVRSNWQEQYIQKVGSNEGLWNNSNVGKYQNGTSYTRVSARHQRTRLLLSGTPWLNAAGEDGRVEERFVPLWTFAIWRCKIRKLARFNFFTCFDGIIKLFQAQDGLLESGRSRRKPCNEKNKLFDSHRSSNPSWRNWKFDDFRLIDRWFEPSHNYLNLHSCHDRNSFIFCWFHQTTPTESAKNTTISKRRMIFLLA